MVYYGWRNIFNWIPACAGMTIGMSEIKPNEVYTTSETQQLLKISNSTMKRLIKRGLLRANKIGKQYRILGHVLLKMLSPTIDERATDLYQKVKRKTVEKTKNW
ncbi:DNA-binding protein [Patescibacteria group bacterium]|nr:MAG: DNA-binding protein [Patescibacteria group bacterium]